MFNTKKLVYIGLFVSISIVLAKILAFYPLPTVRISFGDIPIMLSGIMFGPVAGAAAGAISDLMGTLMFPAPTGAAFFPGFTLSKLLVGVIPALLFRYLKLPTIYKIAVSVVATEIICSLILDTLWLSIMYNKGMLLLIPPRIVTRIIMTILEIPIIYVILERVGKASAFKRA